MGCISMTVCIHGNVCREWMRRTGSLKPLSAICPEGCKHFRKKATVTVYGNGYEITVSGDVSGDPVRTASNVLHAVMSTK